MRRQAKRYLAVRLGPSLIKRVFSRLKVTVEVDGLRNELRGLFREQSVAQANEAGGLQKHAVLVLSATPIRNDLGDQVRKALDAHKEIASRDVPVLELFLFNLHDQTKGPRSAAMKQIRAASWYKNCGSPLEPRIGLGGGGLGESPQEVVYMWLWFGCICDFVAEVTVGKGHDVVNELKVRDTAHLRPVARVCEIFAKRFSKESFQGI